MVEVSLSCFNPGLREEYWYVSAEEETKKSPIKFSLSSDRESRGDTNDGDDDETDPKSDEIDGDVDDDDTGDENDDGDVDVDIDGKEKSLKPLLTYSLGLGLRKLDFAVCQQLRGMHRASLLAYTIYGAEMHSKVGNKTE